MLYQKLHADTWVHYKIIKEHPNILHEILQQQLCTILKRKGVGGGTSQTQNTFNIIWGFQQLTCAKILNTKSIKITKQFAPAVKYFL